MSEPQGWIAALLLALTLDRWPGEPPAALHPVVWLGRALHAGGVHIAPQHATAQPDWPCFWRAALLWFALAVLVWGIAATLQHIALSYLPMWAAALALGILLKPLLAWRMLHSEVQAVEAALGQSLQAGREQLSRLVSRDTRTLDAVAVRESAIESLAENLNDSVVAPIFWFVLLGLPGAALYRFANTADAMWGYPGWRDGRWWQWAGKWAARADDVLSWLPARLTALLLCGAAIFCRYDKIRWHALRAQATNTPSPNGGWPMAAMALALEVQLGKPGVYALNPQGRKAQAQDTQRALRLARITLVAWLALVVALLTLNATVPVTTTARTAHAFALYHPALQGDINHCGTVRTLPVAT